MLSDEFKTRPSRLIREESFNKDVEKYESQLISFFETIEYELSIMGSEALWARKGTKRLTYADDEIYEFRSRIQGHRVFFRYGYQYPEEYGLEDNDIVLCGYCEDHDEITKDANKVADAETAKIDLEIKEVEKEIASCNKFYSFSSTSTNLIPVLNKNQKDILLDDHKYVLVKGVAGSGKTNICVQKIINSYDKEKILYSTFSNDLLTLTRENIYINYIEQIENILKLEDIKMKLIKFTNLGLARLIDDDFSEIKLLLGALKRVEFKFLKEIKTVNKKVVDFECFNNLFKEKDFLSFDLVNKFYNIKISKEVLFKEIEGIILGFYTENEDILPLSKYEEIRGKIFNKNTCSIIHRIACSYYDYLNKSSKYIDKNMIATAVIKDELLEESYDLIILDEAQDYTQREFMSFKHLSKSIFLVGDPLQMINPSYFSFNDVKRLFGSSFGEYSLVLNYRNTETLNEVINDFVDININKLGHHSNFVTKSKAKGILESTNLFYTKEKKVVDDLNASKLDSYTIIVNGIKEKEELKNVVKNKTILTISEAKGLEKDSVVLYNVLSTNYNIWSAIGENVESKKNIDENDLHRYYFNLFYVGVTRAKRHLLIYEDKQIPLFDSLFRDKFKVLDINCDIDDLQEKFDLRILSDDERIKEIDSFIVKKQTENALDCARWIKDKKIKKEQIERINIYKKLDETKDYISALESFVKVNNWKEVKSIAIIIGENDIIQLADYKINGKRIEEKTCLNIIFKAKSKLLVKEAKTIVDEQSEFIKDVSKEIIKELKELL